MPIEIKDVDNGLGNLIIVSGAVTEIEFVEALQRHLTQDPEKFRQYRFSLTDLSKVTELNLSQAVIEEHSRTCIRSADVNPDAVVAVVAPQDLHFGLSRMWEILSDEISWEICIFRCNEEAKMWVRERVKKKWEITDLTFGCTGRL